jgi:hypothetical protein
MNFHAQLFLELWFVMNWSKISKNLACMVQAVIADKLEENLSFA